MIRLLAVLGILGISFSAVFVRLAEVSPATAAFFRAAYALPPLFLLWAMTRGGDHPGRVRRADRLGGPPGAPDRSGVRHDPDSVRRRGAHLRPGSRRRVRRRPSGRRRPGRAHRGGGHGLSAGLPGVQPCAGAAGGGGVVRRAVQPGAHLAGARLAAGAGADGPGGGLAAHRGGVAAGAGAGDLRAPAPPRDGDGGLGAGHLLGEPVGAAVAGRATTGGRPYGVWQTGWLVDGEERS